MADRRKIGAFYTPVELSQILADWAIRSGRDTVLEPSFGGCGFLEAAFKRLDMLGSTDPVASIFGCDIDPVAFEHLSTVFSRPVDLDQFRHIDFLDCEAGAGWPHCFTTVLANPPYIPHQRIGRQRRKELGARTWGVPNVGGRASLWAYFLAHSVSLLEEGGRMAWVLPGAALQADYAASCRDYLRQHFDRCAAIVIRERLFLDEGADEETVILLADGHRSCATEGVIELGEAQTLAELRALIADWSFGRWTGNTTGVSPAALSLKSGDLGCFTALTEDTFCRTIGDFAKVQIGIVTGANPFFVLPQSSLDPAGLVEADCSPILSKYRQAPGLTFTASDHAAALKKGERGWLIETREVESNRRMSHYLATFDAERLTSIGTFRKRSIWHQPCDGKFPDAFLPVMHHDGPRLVFNVLGCNSTNTVHRVYFRHKANSSDHKLLAISLLTTFSQISAEMVGRRYGSGVLKHEPRDAERIQVLMPELAPDAIERGFADIDRHLRGGDAVSASLVADALVLGQSGLSAGQLDHLRLALVTMRERRRPDRKRVERS
ncbi:hypothetical protein FHS97_000599 [Sphingomonas endophytica]|uniref:site-specific DNA-methyltransferase (adenine-specific) n=1 Tax=Sphingomonas endophytica TaxID=869719 RepID=A0ABR6N3M4_9SPHN|nr:N-6 DNA methylase [Sphingomonas endophytica]MBB5724691.1 hypothetical protein [Sphingomonas endophytica]